MLMNISWLLCSGYAVQHNMPVSIRETAQLPAIGNNDFDVHEQGLIELASLFVAFDVFSPQDTGDADGPRILCSQLIRAQETLAAYRPKIANYDLVQQADYQITRHWMRILLWQKAMKQGLLSSTASMETLTFTYPSTVAQQLLASIAAMSGDHLAPLGRDQVSQL